MSEASPYDTPDDARRVLRFNSPADLLSDLKSLQSAKVRSVRKWTLPQACRHLALVIETNLKPADREARTPEEEAAKLKFWGMVFAPGGMPEGIPLPKSVEPPADCGPEEIDRLIAAFEALEKFPHPFITVGRCGPVPVAEVRQLHLAHAAHHLSFIKPAERRKNLVYPTLDAIMADLRLLERGYVQTGTWSLSQMCWHLNSATSYLMSPGPHSTPAAPADGPAKLEAVLKSGQIPDGIQAPPHMLPAADCADSLVEDFIATLERVKTFAGPFAPHRLFGELTPEQGKKLVLLHAARHLSFLVPTTTVIPVK